MAKKLIDFDAYRNFFSQDGFWGKLASVAKKAGIKVIYMALVLYYVTRDPAVPMADKMKIYGALGYFILPTDLIPDAVMAIGFTDDIAALTWAMYTASKYVTPTIEQQAIDKLHDWFGDFDSDEVAEVVPQQ